MCLAPQRRAIFRPVTVKKCPEPLSFLTFWLANVLRATAACHFFQIETCKNGSGAEVFCTFWCTNVLRATAACEFSRSQLQKWLRDCGVLYILTYKCASRHSGVQFFITPLSSYLRTRRFTEATSRTAGTTNHWKNTAIRDFPNISRTCIFWDLTAVVLLFSMTLMLCDSLFLWLEYCSTLLFNSALQLSILSEVIL